MIAITTSENPKTKNYLDDPRYPIFKHWEYVPLNFRTVVFKVVKIVFTPQSVPTSLDLLVDA